jgi:hypothetical protein
VDSQGPSYRTLLTINYRRTDLRYSRVIQYLADRLPHHRSGKVEEMVITRQGLTTDRIWDENRNLLSILAPAGPKKRVNDPLISTLNTKRVVLHLPLSNFGLSHSVLSNVKGWCRWRREKGRKQMQFVVHDIGPNGTSCRSMDAEFHFTLHQAPGVTRTPTGLRRDMSFWLYNNLGHNSKVDRVIVHPSLVIEKGEYPADLFQANQLARNIIEQHAKECVDFSPGKNPAAKKMLVASLMGKIVFGDGGYVKEEYAVLNPNPVGHPSRAGRNY